MSRKMLGEILLEEHCIDEVTLKRALEKQKQYAMTDSHETSKLPIPYVIQPDWKIAWFFKIGILPVLLLLVAKMARMQENNALQENFPTLLAMLAAFLVMDLLVIRHTYVQKVVMYNDRLIYKGKHTIKYADITKVLTGFHFSLTQVGYRAKVFTKGNEEPVLINISLFDSTDLKVMYSILRKQTEKADFDEFSEKIESGKVNIVENDLAKWLSLVAGIAVLVVGLISLSNIMFK